MERNIGIRRTQYEDCNFCIDLWTNKEVGKYLIDPPKEESYKVYDKWKSTIHIYEGCYYFVGEEKEKEELFGTCSCVPNLETEIWDIGYVISREYQNKGYGAAMVTLLIQFCKENGAKSITAEVAKDNTASKALLNKLGFSIVREGRFNKIGTDAVLENFVFE